MGYSGQPMVSVQNNRNLIGKRRTIWDYPKDLNHTNNSKSDGKTRGELETNSAYEKDQIVKRRQKLLKSNKKQTLVKNIVSAGLYIFVVITLTYIINYI